MSNARVIDIQRLEKELEELDPQDKQKKCELHFNLGKALMQNADLTGSVVHLENALMLDSTNKELNSSLILLYGRVLIRQGDFNKALTLLLDFVRKQFSIYKVDNSIILSAISEIIDGYIFFGNEEIATLLKQKHDLMAKNLQENVSSFETLNILCDIASTLVVNDFKESEQLYKCVINWSQYIWGEKSPETATFLNAYGEGLRTCGKYSEAKDVLDLALLIRRKNFDTDSLFVAESTNNSGLLFRALGKLQDAENLLEESLFIRRKVVGDNNPLTAASYNNLAELFREKKEFLKAIQYHDLAVIAFRQSVGDSHPSYKNAVGNLAVTMCYQGRHGLKEGESVLKDTIEFFTKANYPDDHPWMLKFKTEYVVVQAEKYSAEGKHEEALILLEQAQNREPRWSMFTEMINKFVEREKFEVLCYNAILLRNEGKYSEAAAIFKVIISDSKGNNSLSSRIIDLTFESSENLKCMGDVESAMKLLEIVYEYRKVTVGQRDRKTIQALIAQASLLCLNDNFKEAEAQFCKVNDLCPHLLSFHESTERDTNDELTLRAYALKEFAVLKYYQGNYMHAIKMLMRSIEIYRSIKLFLEVAMCKYHLGCVYIHVGRLVDAAQMLNEAKITFSDTFNQNLNHPVIAIITVYLGYISLIDNKYEYAYQVIQKSITIMESVGMEHHREYIWAMLLVGKCYIRMSKFVNAKNQIDKVIDCSDSIFGHCNTFVAKCLFSKGELSLELGQFDEAMTNFVQSLNICAQRFSKFHVELIRCEVYIARTNIRRCNLLDAHSEIDVLSKKLEHFHSQSSTDAEDPIHFPIYLDVLATHGEYLMTVGCFREAASQLELANNIAKSFFGEKHGVTVELSFLYLRNASRYQNPTKLVDSAQLIVDVRRETVGEESVLYAEAVLLLNELYTYSANPKRLSYLSIIHSFNECIYIFSRHFGNKSLAKAAAQKSMAEYMMIENEMSDVLRYLVGTLDIYRETLSPSHLLLAETLVLIGDYYRIHRNLSLSEHYYLDAQAIYQKHFGDTEKLNPFSLNAEGNMVLLSLNETSSQEDSSRLNYVVTKLIELGMDIDFKWLVKFTSLGATNVVNESLNEIYSNLELKSQADSLDRISVDSTVEALIAELEDELTVKGNEIDQLKYQLNQLQSLSTSSHTADIEEVDCLKNEINQLEVLIKQNTMSYSEDLNLKSAEIHQLKESLTQLRNLSAIEIAALKSEVASKDLEINLLHEEIMKSNNNITALKDNLLAQAAELDQDTRRLFLFDENHSPLKHESDTSAFYLSNKSSLQIPFDDTLVLLQLELSHMRRKLLMHDNEQKLSNGIIEGLKKDIATLAEIYFHQNNLGSNNHDNVLKHVNQGKVKNLKADLTKLIELYFRFYPGSEISATSHTIDPVIDDVEPKSKDYTDEGRMDIEALITIIRDLQTQPLGIKYNSRQFIHSPQDEVNRFKNDIVKLFEIYFQDFNDIQPSETVSSKAQLEEIQMQCEVLRKDFAKTIERHFLEMTKTQLKFNEQQFDKTTCHEEPFSYQIHSTNHLKNHYDRSNLPEVHSQVSSEATNKKVAECELLKQEIELLKCTIQTQAAVIDSLNSSIAQNQKGMKSDISENLKKDLAKVIELKFVTDQCQELMDPLKMKFEPLRNFKALDPNEIVKFPEAKAYQMNESMFASNQQRDADNTQYVYKADKQELNNTLDIMNVHCNQVKQNEVQFEKLQKLDMVPAVQTTEHHHSKTEVANFEEIEGIKKDLARVVELILITEHSKDELQWQLSSKQNEISQLSRVIDTITSRQEGALTKLSGLQLDVVQSECSVRKELPISEEPVLQSDSELFKRSIIQEYKHLYNQILIDYSILSIENKRKEDIITQKLNETKALVEQLDLSNTSINIANAKVQNLLSENVRNSLDMQVKLNEMLQIEEQLDYLKDEVTTKEAVIQQLQATIDILNSTLESTRVAELQLKHEIVELMRIPEILKLEINDIKSNYEQKSKLIIDIQNINEAKTRQLKDLFCKNEELESNLKTANKNLRIQQKSIDVLKEQVQNLEQSLVDEAKNSTTLREQIEQLKQQKKSLDPWGFVKESELGFCRFSTSSTMGNRPLSYDGQLHNEIIHDNLKTFLGFKAFNQPRVTTYPNEQLEEVTSYDSCISDLTQNVGTLSTHIEEILTGSAPSKLFSGARTIDHLELDHKGRPIKTAPSSPFPNSANFVGDEAYHPNVESAIEQRARRPNYTDSCNEIVNSPTADIITSKPPNIVSSCHSSFDKEDKVQKEPKNQVSRVSSRSSSCSRRNSNRNDSKDMIEGNQLPPIENSEQSRRCLSAPQKKDNLPKNSLLVQQQFPNTESSFSKSLKVTSQSKSVELNPVISRQTKKIINKPITAADLPGRRLGLYGCSDTEGDLLSYSHNCSLGSDSLSKRKLNTISTHSSSTRYHPEIFWDPRYQKSPYDEKAIPKQWPSDDYAFVKDDEVSLILSKKQFGLY